MAAALKQDDLITSTATVGPGSFWRLPKYREGKKFHLREYPQSGSKAKDVKDRKKKKDRKSVPVA